MPEKKPACEHETFLESIFRVAPIGIGVVVDRVIKEVNDRFCQMLGYERDELVGQSARLVYPSDEEYRYVGKEKYRQIAARNTGSVNTRLLRKDGQVIDVLLSSTALDPADLSKGVTFTALDITEQVRVSDRLQAERNRAQRYLDIAPSIILALDPQANIVLLNQEGGRILGCVPEEVIGRNWFDQFVPKDWALEVKKVFIELMAGREQTLSHYESEVVTRRGDRRTIQWHNILLRDEADQPAGTLSSGVDVTERKRTEESVRWELSVNQALADLSRALLVYQPSVEEISRLVQKYALSLTGSLHGYVASVDPQDGALIAHTLVATMADCRVPGGAESIVFPRGKDGTYPKLWGHSLNTRRGFFSNQPASHPARGGVPDGHVPITNFLSVPAIAGNRLMGQVTLANSNRGFNERDLRAIERLTDLYAVALKDMQAIEALRESEIRYRTFVENFQGIAFRGRMDFTPLFFHGAVEEITGYREEDFLSGRPTWDQIIHPEDLSSIKDTVHRISSEPGFTTVREYRILHRKGQVRWVREQIQNICDQSGTPVYVQGAMTDITPLKQVEEQLRHRLEQEMLIGRISSGFINLEPEQIDQGIVEALGELGEFSRADRCYVYQFNQEIDALINTHEWCAAGIASFKEDQTDIPIEPLKWGMQPLFEGRPLCIPDVSALPPEAAAVRRLMQKKQVSSVVCVPLKIRGKTIGLVGFDSAHEPRDWTRENILLLTTVAGMVAGALDRQRAERDRDELESQLRHAQKMEAIGTLAGGLAHDFNNLLTGILGHVSMLRALDAGEEHRLRAADVIENAANQATELTHKLLGFARKGKLQKQPVDMHRIIGDTASILERTFDKRIQVSMDLQANPATVIGDPGQLGQAIMNLAINARDAMPEGGRLAFETRVQNLGQSIEDQKDGLAPGAHVCVVVRDSGIGMTEEVRQRVFDPFFTTKQPGEGTGMGLATVYGITRNHGGCVRVTSKPGEGSVFQVCLPVGQAASVEQEAVPSEPTRGEGTILVVDDEEMVLEVTNLMLEYLGYRVVLASGGREALAYFKDHHHQVDLVLLDMIMPGMNGRTCFRELKKIKPDVRVVLATGHAVEGAVQELLDEGMRGVVQKPFVLENLSRHIAGALAGRQTKLQ